MFGWRGFGRRSRSCIFGCGWHLVHRTVVHAPGDPLQSRNLNTGKGRGTDGQEAHVPSRSDGLEPRRQESDPRWPWGHTHMGTHSTHTHAHTHHICLHTLPHTHTDTRTHTIHTGPRTQSHTQTHTSQPFWQTSACIVWEAGCHGDGSLPSPSGKTAMPTGHSFPSCETLAGPALPGAAKF